MDPKLASYGVDNPIFAVVKLAQTTMRSELGKITLDKTFEERSTLNRKIVVCFVRKIIKGTCFECVFSLSLRKFAPTRLLMFLLTIPSRITKPKNKF